MCDIYYRTYVKKRMGRPPTGHQPHLSVRMDKDALAKAKERAKAEGTTVGRWLEAAIREKLERDSNGT